MLNGWIKTLVASKGFGFIRDDQDTEYFFDRSALDRGRFEDLTKGQQVSFTVGDGPKGPRAENVKLI